MCVCVYNTLILFSALWDVCWEKKSKELILKQLSTSRLLKTLQIWKHGEEIVLFNKRHMEHNYLSECGQTHYFCQKTDNKFYRKHNFSSLFQRSADLKYHLTKAFILTKRKVTFYIGILISVKRLSCPQLETIRTQNLKIKLWCI